MTRLKFPTPHALSLFALLVPVLAGATQPSAIGGASTSAQAASRGTMSVGSNGSALSYAASSQSATARLTTASPSRNAAAIAGETTTRSSGVAYNTSTGTASGMAKSTGSVATQVQGGVALGHGKTAGGIAGTESSFAIVAGRNQGSGLEGGTTAGFEASLHRGVPSATGNTAPSYTTGPATGVQVNTSGYVTGSNASAALQGMAPADVARIDASGFFKVKGDTGGSVGVASPQGAPRHHGGAR